MTEDSTAGFTTVPNWMLAAEDVTAHMVLVYAALGTYTNREGTAFPSVPKIATRAKISDRSARTALRSLEDLGLVETLRRGLPTGGQTSNLYRLHTSVTPRQDVQPPLHDVQGPPAPRADEQEPSNNLSAKAESVKRERATRIPEPFIVTAEMWAWAEDEGMSRDWAHGQTVVFVDYWRGRSGQIATKHDWPATWRNWLRRAKGDDLSRMGGAGRPRPESPDERVKRLMRLADEMERGDGEQGAIDA